MITICFQKQSILNIALPTPKQQTIQMQKAITLLEQDPEDNQYSKKARMQTISIRVENRDRVFKRNRVRMDQRQEEHQQDKESNKPQGDCQQQTNESNIFYADSYRKFYHKHPNMQYFPSLVTKIKSDELSEKIEGAVGLRILLSQSQAPIKQAIQQGVVDEFIRIALQKDACPQLKVEAIWGLASASSGTMEECGYLIDRQCIQLFARILKEQKMPNLLEAVWFFGNMACEFNLVKKAILAEGVMANLIDILFKFEDKEVIENAAWTISNLCRDNPIPPYEQVEEGVEALCRALALGRIQREKQFVECLWAITHHIISHKRLIHLIMQTNLYTKVIQILKEDEDCDFRLIFPCLRFLTNLLSDNDSSIVQKLLDYDILGVAEKSLYSKKKGVRIQACKQLSFIASSTTQHVQVLLMRKPIILRMKQMLMSQVQEIRLEIAVFFCNICQPIQDYEQELIKMGLVDHFVRLLQSNQPYILISILQALKKPLLSSREKDGNEHNAFALRLFNSKAIPLIEKLQEHQDDAVYNSAKNLLDGGCFTFTQYQQLYFHKKEEVKEVKKSKKQGKGKFKLRKPQ